MDSPTKKDDIQKTETAENSVFTKTDLRGDWMNFFLLFLMYTMQALPFGISSAISIILQSKHPGSYYKQALFSLSGYPFSLKLFWAPLVDAFYVKMFGRRKTWLIPAQLSIGVVLMYSASEIDRFLPETGEPDVHILMYVFFILNLLSATQDIAVDGWALTMLKKNNVGYASVCNSSGQALGVIVGNLMTVLLTSEKFSNKYLRSEPGVGGLISINSLLYGWGMAFILITTLIAIFKKERDLTLEDNYLELNIVQNYSLLWDIFKIRNVQILALALLTVKIGFAATDAATEFKLMDAGISKDDITIINTCMHGVNMIVPLVMAKHTSGPKSLSIYLTVIPIRLFMNILCVVFVYFTPAMIYNHGVLDIPVYYYAVLMIVFSSHQILMYTMFVTLIAFFSRISDPRFGGTYMTLLNTLANFGNMWTATAALGMINLLTFKKCSIKNHDVLNAAHEDDDCIITVDGYYIEVIVCTVIGFIWLYLFKNKLEYLRTLSFSQWLVNKKKTVTTDHNSYENSVTVT